METKIIPFDLETAKKIQAGEIKGRVLDKDNFEGTIITTNGYNTPLPVVIKFSFSDRDNIGFFGIDGNTKGNKLVLEVPDNEPQFKPFDKVLVKPYDMSEQMMDVNVWMIDVFSHIDKCTGDYICIGGRAKPEYTLPYEGNEHLVGTTDNPNKE